MKLSKRLRSLLDRVDCSYEHVWDCCCDHGYLGQAILAQHPDSQVHFLDVVESITAKLEKNLVASDFSNERWQVHCEDLQRFELPRTSTPQLLIIAGVGGDLTLDMIRALLKNNPDQAFDLLICPIRQLYKLRQGLSDLPIGLLAEQIVKEGKHFYELIHLSTSSKTAIHPVGDRMWNLAEPDHQAYRKQRIEHYQRMLGRDEVQASAIVSAYQALAEE